MKDRLKEKAKKRLRQKVRIRKVVSGTPDRPRLCVKRSLNNIYVQLIDDVNGVTLASASSVSKDFPKKDEKGKTYHIFKQSLKN